MKENSETVLTNLLQKEYDKSVKKFGQQLENRSKSRKAVMIKIRCSLVKNPYDTGGRILAMEAKNVFLKNVLKETYCLSSFLERIKVFQWLQKSTVYNHALTYLPLIWAIFSILRGVAIYSYDISTDVAVIEEIEVTKDSFRIPGLSEFDQNYGVIQGFIKTKFQYPGASSSRKPCLYIQDAENMLRSSLIGYDQILYHLGNVRIMGNSSFFDASDMAELLANVLNVTKDIPDYSLLPLSDLPEKIDDLLDNIQDKIPGKTFWTRIVGANDEIDYAKRVFSNVKFIWTEIARDILGLQIAQHIVGNIDSLWKLWKEGGDYFPQDPQPYITLFKDSAEKLSKHYIQNESSVHHLPQPDPYGETENFNDTQVYCRKYVNEVYNLFHCKDTNCKGEEHKKIIASHISSIFEQINEMYNHNNSIDNPANSLLFTFNPKHLFTPSLNAKFSTNYMFNCIRLYLTFLLIFNILRECYTCFIDMKEYGVIPIKTNADLSKMELTKTSKIFSKIPMSNRELFINAIRFDTNINEAIRETLGAVCIQIALFMWLNTAIYGFQDTWNYMILNSNVSNASKHAVSIENFNLTEASIVFHKSPIFDSLISGMISVAFAQFQMYSVRHSGDLELMGMLVYFTACLLNTICIFLSMTMYYSFGLPNFILILTIIIGRVAGNDDGDNFIPLPESSEWIWLITW